MSKKLFGKFFIFLLVVGLLFAVAPTGQALAQTPTGYEFIQREAGTAAISTEKFYSSNSSVKFTTGAVVDNNDAAMIRFTFPDGFTLDELTALNYWEYVDTRLNDLDVFVDIWLDYDNDGVATTDDYPAYMQAEPLYTWGNAATLDTWTYVEGMTLKWSVGVTVNDPYNGPTIAQLQANTADPKWTGGIDFGPLDILRIDVRVGYGYPTWNNFIGYADDITINGYVETFPPNEVWVCPTGDCGHLGAGFNTIQGGINAVAVGGKVNVAAGTYNENLVIDKSLTLQGAGIDQTIVQAVQGRNYNGGGFQSPIVNVTGNAALLNLKPINITAPAAVAGPMSGSLAQFGAQPGDTAWNISGNVVYASDPVGCTQPTNVAGKIAMIDRGTCTFSVKADNAQKAGAIGVIIVNSTDELLIMSGTAGYDVTIPVVMITKTNGDRLKPQTGVTAAFQANPFGPGGLTIDGFTFRGNVPTTVPAGWTGPGTGQIDGLSTQAINTDNTARQNITITHNKFVYAGSTIALYNTIGFDISNNTMVRASVNYAGYGYKAHGGQIAHVSGCLNGTIANNTGFDPVGTITVASSNVDVIGNTIAAPAAPLAGDLAIAQYGIAAMSGSNINIKENTISGLKAGPKDSYNNGWPGAGIWAYSTSSGVSIIDNTLENNVIGVHTEVTSAAAAPVLTGNIFINNVYSVFNQSGNIGTATIPVNAEGNYWGSASGPNVFSVAEMGATTWAQFYTKLSETPSPFPANAISDMTGFTPWCGEAECTTLLPPVHNVTKDTYYNTIQAAIDAADNADEIRVGPGIYNENLLINKQVTLLGAGKDTDGNYLTIVNGVNPTTDAGMVNIQASNVTIDGFKFVSAGYKTVRITQPTSHVTFRNNYVVGAEYTSGGGWILFETNYGTAQTNLSILNNVFENNGSQIVMYINPTNPGLVITGNTFQGDLTSGPVLAIDGMDGTQTISGNTFNIDSTYALFEAFGTYNINAIFSANTWKTGYVVVGNKIMIPPTKLYMSPASMTKDINGGQQVVEIMVTDVEDMTAYHMEVTFDHTKLQVVKVENGGLLSSEHTTVVEEPGKDPGNTTGRLKFGAYLQAIGGVNYPVSGSGSLVKITFQPINFGETSFTIDGALSALYDWPNAFPIPYEVTTGETDVNIVGFGPGVSFGYVAYEAAPNRWLRGVSTDFTIVGADLTDATSLVVKLWGGDGGTILLQTNTANLSGTLFDGFTGFTSPFDIFGNFNYADDGYWTNARETEYGKTTAPTCVEATATLTGGTVITKKYCGPLVPGDRSLLLRGTIEPDGGTGQVPGGTPLIITNENDTVSYQGLIEWYPADESIGRTEGNRVGVEINAPTAFDTTDTTFTVFGNTYTWDAVNDGTNFVWIYPKVTTVPQQWDIVVAWGGNISQTFTVKVLTGSTLNTPPLPTITSTDVVGPYIPGVSREFNITMSNLGSAIYERMIFDYTLEGVSKSDITSFEYSIGTGPWIVMGSRSTETYADCVVGGVASICGQFGLAPDGFGPVGPDFNSTTTFRINFKNGFSATLPFTLNLSGKKLATDTTWTPLRTFTANVQVYQNVQVTGTVPVYYLVGDPGISTITITNPAGGAPYGNHIEFNLTILNAVKADITSATCTYGTVTLDILGMLSESGGNLTGTLFPADGAFNVSAPFNMTISCTTVFNTAKSYIATSEMKYVVGTNKYTVATNTATAVVYPKPAIVSPLLPGSFQQGVAKDIIINVNNVGTMHTPNSFTLHLALPAGTVVVYGANTYTCTATGCDIPVILSAGNNALPLTVMFNAPSTADVTISLVDSDIDPGRILATFTGPNVVHASIALVTGSVTMQGRNTYNYAKFTLTGTQIGYGPYPSTSNAAGELSFANIIADVYTVTTEMPRYLNITSDMVKKITLPGTLDNALNALWMRAGNAKWIGDNSIDALDAGQVGTNWGGSGSLDLTINHGDVNFDNTVNIQDLALVGGNFDLTSAIAYATWLP